VYCFRKKKRKYEQDQDEDLFDLPKKIKIFENEKEEKEYKVQAIIFFKNLLLLNKSNVNKFY
jgi:hypothetical protein